MVIDENMLKVDIAMTEEYREVSHSVFRLTSVEHWIYDLKLRMSIWKKAFSIGLENPVLGAGASKYRSLYLSTPHNIFISVFLTSGLLGIFTFLFLIVMCYSTFFSFYNLEHYPRITKFFFISFTTLLFVGATNDFSGGRYLLFFILISGISIAQKISFKDLKTNDQTK
jgi:O-antigen ligase